MTGLNKELKYPANQKEPVCIHKWHQWPKSKNALY